MKNGQKERGVSRKAAFTLAEVLIAILIIGVVAALTLPALFRNISDRVNSTKVSVFNSKLVQALNSTKAAGELNNTYTDTYDFLQNGLSHHLKMTMICDNDNLKDCFNYKDENITYENKSGKEKTVKISTLKTAKKINIKDSNFADTAAFVMADGTPVLLTYNTKCTADGGADKTISPCIAGLFDINGSRKPNMFLNKIENGKSEARDIRSFNGASVADCIGFINDMCIRTAAMETHESDIDQMINSIKAVEPDYDRPTWAPGATVTDGWQISKDYCDKVLGSKLPTPKQLAEIAKELYGAEINYNGSYDSTSGLTMKNKDAVYAALGLNTSISSFFIWSNYSQYVNYCAYGRQYNSSSTNSSPGTSRSPASWEKHWLAVCIE